MRLANKVAIVTGGSSGIGRAAAILFAREGAKIAVAADMNVVGGEETAAKIKAAGGDAIFVKTDVSIAMQVENLVKKTVQKFGKVDIVFNNAGTMLELAPVEQTKEETWDHTFAVNVKSIFLMAKYVVPELKKNRGGSIINNASAVGIRPRPENVSYTTSKGAANVLTRALALELAPFNIRVNAVNPFATRTDILKKLPADELRKVAGFIPMGHIGEELDVANAALYLASDESAMVTGQIIGIDGGYTI
jgi:3-oxoacyl-[acyl-carrier protein] reductase